MNLDFVNTAEEKQLKLLLAESGLYSDDIRSSDLRHFLVMRDGTRLAGVVGLEVVGESSLLRSLAVSPRYRNKGIPSGLVKRVEEYARSKGIEKLYLLTITAEEFFAKQGCQEVNC
ncbi:MAG: GNAT family N-acetyltransferase [Spirochaetes bacterium]|nr:GNAT family N-acetyltransferase [Spirochaetota bacterium]